jgi:hypothetical protein
MTQRAGASQTLVFVGGGPRTVGILERLAANAPDIPGSARLSIHIVDPFPAGGGRIWRAEQSPLLWMNSKARDVTIFTDSSVSCEGPIVTGPTLAEWIIGEGRTTLAAAGLGEQAAGLRPDDFAGRQIQAHYLRWAHNRAVASLPARITVTEHAGSAAAVREDRNAQRVLLADGSELPADVVVLAQGYLDREPTPEERRLSAAAERHGLTYIPPGYTADVDLSDLRPGEPVLVRGFGLAFVDLMVLLGEGRGGRFERSADGELRYHPSGAEPVLHVGSRRGVPYHAKLGYSLSDSTPVPARYFTTEAVAALGADGRPADFRHEIWPLMAKELTAAHYRQLFAAHPERTLVSWSEFSAILDTADVSGAAFADVVERAVPKREDRFELLCIDKPLAGGFFGSRQDLTDAVLGHIQGDLRRRADPYFSADAAVFDALLTVYGVLAVALTTGKISAADRIALVEGQFHGFFSFLASGPPPRRLEELIALHRAGLVHFAGPDLDVEVVDGNFSGSSPAAPGRVAARALVDARLPRPDVRAATDPIIRGLLADGELAAEDITTPDGRSLGGGQLLADFSCRAIRADGTVHPRRFLLGPSVSGSAGSAGFSRPGFNGAGFRQNDAVARNILRLFAEQETTDTASPSHEIHRSKELHHAR